MKMSKERLDNQMKLSYH